jgi:hypothetical protein
MIKITDKNLDSYLYSFYVLISRGDMRVLIQRPCRVALVT